MPATCNIAFLSSSQRPCVAELAATYPGSDGPRTMRSFIRLSALPLNFLRLPQTFSRPLPGPDKFAFSMLKHLPRSGIDFFYIFNLFWIIFSFHLADIFYYSHPQEGKAFDSSPFWRLIFSPLHSVILLSPPGRYSPWTVYFCSIFFSPVRFRWV